jgi:predicted nucleotidyltransferase
LAPGYTEAREEVDSNPIPGDGPTPYAEANSLLDVLLDELPGILGQRLVGIYLHGSLASGDFDPRTSDIDFLVVTAEELSGDAFQAVAAMHGRLVASGQPWVTKLEGSYIPQRALRRYDPRDTRYPALSVGGDFGPDEHGSDWIIQRHLIRERALVLTGPSPRCLIDPVPPDDVARAVRATLAEWWAPQLDDLSRMCRRDYQAYAVLTMCRALYTLHHGDVASKRVAARWSQGILEARWAPVIERALDWSDDAQADRLDESLDFLRMVLAAAGVPVRSAVR